MTHRARVLRETDADGSTWTGPVFVSTEDPCLQCFLRRRQASSTPLGALSWSADVPDDARDDLQRGDRARSGDVHRFLPLPTCRCPRIHRFRVGRVPLPRMVSCRVGPVDRLTVTARDDRVTTVRSVGARICGSGGVPVLSDGHGSHTDPLVAGLLALHESAEHYAAGFWNHSPATTLRGAGAHATVRGRDADDGRGHDLAARDVFLPYPADGTYQDSAGLAAGRSVADAAERSLREAVERAVLWSMVDGRVAPDLDRSRGATLRWLYSADRDLIVALVGRLADRPPYFAFGLGCAEHESEALEKAAREQEYVAVTLRAALRSKAYPPARSRLDALLLTVARDRRAAVRFVTGAREAKRERVRRSYAIVDLTTSDLGLFGLAVVRAVVVPVSGPELTSP